MSFLNISGYKFTPLSHLDQLKNELFTHCESLAIKGTILLSEEGTNINLSGAPNDIQCFQSQLQNFAVFKDISFHKTRSDFPIYKRLKVKIKKEIITFKQNAIKPAVKRAQTLAPHTLKQWLDEKKEFTLLDVRNDYEIKLGTFESAQHFALENFGQMVEKENKLPAKQPIVTFCTGGIRCEKAALYLTQLGYENVYQLEGGILGYFNQVGEAHYVGHCFVFDDRVAIDAQFQSKSTRNCQTCQAPITLTSPQDSNTICQTC